MEIYLEMIKKSKDLQDKKFLILQLISPTVKNTRLNLCKGADRSVWIQIEKGNTEWFLFEFQFHKQSRFNSSWRRRFRWFWQRRRFVCQLILTDFSPPVSSWRSPASARPPCWRSVRSVWASSCRSSPSPGCRSASSACRPSSPARRSAGSDTSPTPTPTPSGFNSTQLCSQTDWSTMIVIDTSRTNETDYVNVLSK